MGTARILPRASSFEQARAFQLAGSEHPAVTAARGSYVFSLKKATFQPHAHLPPAESDSQSSVVVMQWHANPYFSRSL